MCNGRVCAGVLWCRAEWRCPSRNRREDALGVLPVSKRSAFGPTGGGVGSCAAMWGQGGSVLLSPVLSLLSSGTRYARGIVCTVPCAG